MLWVFDAVEPARTSRLDIRRKQRRDGRRYETFRWRHPRKSVAACTAQVLLDLGGGHLLDVKKLYPDAPCGGWGYLISADDVPCLAP